MLVHCENSILRSPTIVNIIKVLSISVLEAYHLVKLRHAIIGANLSFMDQLLKREYSTSVDVDFDALRRGQWRYVSL